ncbi:MAG: hypothetical protein QM811_04380 [Pirellulales bacterium]
MRNCKVNMRVAIDTPEVADWLKKNDGVALLADRSTEIPDNEEMLAKLNRKSIPLLAVFPAGEPLKPLVYDGIIQQSTVLGALEKGGPQKAAQPVAKTADVSASKTLD